MKAFAVEVEEVVTTRKLMLVHADSVPEAVELAKSPSPQDPDRTWPMYIPTGNGWGGNFSRNVMPRVEVNVIRGAYELGGAGAPTISRPATPTEFTLEAKESEAYGD